MSQSINVPELFGTDVFNEATMQQRLAPEVSRPAPPCPWTLQTKLPTA